MNDHTLEVFDTTLRDGTQGVGINVSIRDKIMITQKLDEFGVDIIEGGWPGSNPKDEEYFREARSLNLSHAVVCAFGSTARKLDAVAEDKNLNMLLAAETEAISIFGKTWRFHSEKSLGLSDEENEELIYRSVEFLKSRGRRVIFDAEHFYDGYKDDRDFALRMIAAAEKAGAETIALCDTNGGSLPDEVRAITEDVREHISTPLGVHAHNDSGLGVANTLAAVDAGARQVQGTINGFGERCGNANLCSVLPNVSLKKGFDFTATKNLGHLSSLSNYVYELTNLAPNSRAPFVGKSAFAHKGGIHVSSVLKDSRMYEHIDPKRVGNTQRVVVSDLSGQSNIRYKAKELGIDLDEQKDLSKKFVQRIKSLEFEGFQFEGAEASFELLLRGELDERVSFFNVTYAKVNVMFDEEGEYSEAVLKVEVDGEVEHTASDGEGPVNALDKALRKAIRRFYPEVGEMRLVDYKVRVLNEKSGTAANVRVLIEFEDEDRTWATVGVSHNIIQASMRAVVDGVNHKLYRVHRDEKETVTA